MPSPRHVVVIGGGVAGLTAAYALKNVHKVAAAVTVLEASPRCGGWLNSQRQDGFLFENGCRGIRPVGSGKAAIQLIEELGLQPLTLASGEAARHRYIMYQGAIHELPSSLPSVFSSHLTRRLPWDALRDLAIARPGTPIDKDDESIDSFITRHFGEHAATILADAALSGIYAGDIRQLSVKSVLRSLWDMERSHGSVLLAALAGLRRPQPVPALSPADDVSPFVAACQRASSISFVDGMGTLPDALQRAFVSQPGAALHTGARVIRVARQRGEGAQPLVVSYSQPGGTGTVDIVADVVVSALPASSLAAALEGGSASSPSEDVLGVIGALRDIPVSSIGVACMGFRRGGLLQRSGFGYLVPRSERYWKGGGGEGHVGRGGSPPLASPAAASEHNTGRQPSGVLGMVWDSLVFPGQHARFADAVRAGWLLPTRDGKTAALLPHQPVLLQPKQPTSPPSPPPELGSGDWHETRVSVMMGGATAPWVTGSTPADIRGMAERALSEHLGILAAPDSVCISVAADTIPQYTVGHSARVDRVETGLEAAFGQGRCVLVGNAFRGIGVADIIARSLQAGRAIAQRLQ